MAGVRRLAGGCAAGGAAKRLRSDGADAVAGSEVLQAASGEIFEVRYATAHEAQAALQLDGSAVQGNPISVKADLSSKDGTKVIVEGLPPGIGQEDLKAYFSGVGAVVFAGLPKKPPVRAFVTGPANGVGEVRFETPEEAVQALGILDGSVLEGVTISATLDQSSKDNSKLIVAGLPAGLQWQELKDHCSQGGRVAYANVKEAGAPVVATRPLIAEATMEGEVRYDDPQHAQTALQHLNGSFLGGQQIWIRADPNSKDHTRLVVSGFPASIQWQELKDHFSRIGTVAFAQVKNDGQQSVGRSLFGASCVPWGGKPVVAMGGKGGVLNKTGMYGKAAVVTGGQKWLARPALAPGYGSWGAGKSVVATTGKGSCRGSGWTSTSGGLGSGEVRYDSPLHARTAVVKLNGSLLQGSRLSVTADETSQDGSKVVVHGIPASCQWQELKDHFGQVGQVAFASIVGPGEVRMETRDEAQRAVELLNGAEVLGSLISVTMDPSSKDGTRLVVNNLPSSVNWQQMKDIFGQAGTVAFATRQEAH